MTLKLSSYMPLCNTILNCFAVQIFGIFESLTSLHGCDKASSGTAAVACAVLCCCAMAPD